jgi:hypothetical protein
LEMSIAGVGFSVDRGESIAKKGNYSLEHRFSHLTNDKSESVIEAALLKISTEISAGYEQSSFHGRTGALYDMTVIFWRMFCQIP